VKGAMWRVPFSALDSSKKGSKPATLSDYEILKSKLTTRPAANKG